MYTQPERGQSVSVVIPVRDDSALLRRCLAALAAQSRLPDEIVVVDNGSSDDSAAVALAAGAHVVPHREPGIAAASAAGYDAARGDLILRLDADCIPDRTWVETVVAAFARRPDVAAFTGFARFVDGPRGLRVALAAVYLAAYVTVTAPALGHLPLFGSNMAVRRDTWLRVRSTVHLRPDIHDDLDLALHLGERHRIRLLPQAAMGMSMRPFADRSAFARRVGRGFRTVVLHWPADFPPVRWVRLLLRRAGVGRLPAGIARAADRRAAA